MYDKESTSKTGLQLVWLTLQVSVGQSPFWYDSRPQRIQYYYVYSSTRCSSVCLSGPWTHVIKLPVMLFISQSIGSFYPRDKANCSSAHMNYTLAEEGRAMPIWTCMPRLMVLNCICFSDNDWINRDVGAGAGQRGDWSPFLVPISITITLNFNNVNDNYHEQTFPVKLTSTTTSITSSSQFKRLQPSKVSHFQRCSFEGDGSCHKLHACRNE